MGLRPTSNHENARFTLWGRASALPPAFWPACRASTLTVAAAARSRSSENAAEPRCTRWQETLIANLSRGPTVPHLNTPACLPGGRTEALPHNFERQSNQSADLQRFFRSRLREHVSEFKDYAALALRRTKAVGL